MTRVMLTFLWSLIKYCHEPLYVSRYLQGHNRSGVSQCSATFHQVVFCVRYSKNSLSFSRKYLGEERNYNLIVFKFNFNSRSIYTRKFKFPKCWFILLGFSARHFFQSIYFSNSASCEYRIRLTFRFTSYFLLAD